MDRIGRDHFHSELHHAMGNTAPGAQDEDIATQSFRTASE